MTLPKIFTIRKGDVMTFAGRLFLVDQVRGSGWSMEVVLITNNIFISPDGPTNMLKCTIQELLDRLIVIQRRKV